MPRSLLAFAPCLLLAACIDDLAPPDTDVAAAALAGWTEVEEMQGQDANLQLGIAVAMDGDTALVGERNGVVHVLVRDDEDGLWRQQATLKASDRADGDQFGTAVAVSGNTAIVGASGHDAAGTDAGAAYVYRRTGTTWQLQAKLIASQASSSDRFGVAVAIDGDRAVVGAEAADGASVGNGAVYAFERSGSSWTQVGKLIAMDGAYGDRFGQAVDVDGTWVLVGAPGKNSMEGAAYVFQRQSSFWRPFPTLESTETFAGSQFGASVALHQGTALIGAYQDWSLHDKQGAAYVFVHQGSTWNDSSWTFQARLFDTEGSLMESFGRSVAIRGNTAAIGAPHVDLPNGGSPDGGAAYVFVRSGTQWTKQARLASSDYHDRDHFGTAVGIGNGRLLVGAPGHDTWDFGAGAAYFFAAEP